MEQTYKASSVRSQTRSRQKDAVLTSYKDQSNPLQIKTDTSTS